MEKEQARAAYDLWHKQRAGEESPRGEIAYPWHQNVARLLPDLNGARVLEIGCGRGDFALWLARKYPLAAITGIDFSNGAIAVALAKLSSHNLNVQFLVDDAENLSFSADVFDYIISCECLEHVPQPERMAHEMARVLKPTGRF